MKRLTAFAASVIRNAILCKPATGVGRVVLTIAIMLGTLATVTTVAASPASAATDSSTTIVIIKNSYTGRCVDDSFKYGLRTIGCNGDNNQKWKLKASNPNPNLPYVFQNYYTGRCMDDSHTYGLRTISCNNDGYQAWYILFNYGDGLQDYGTGYCLDDSFKYGLRAIHCNFDANQQWGF